jgi:hypothetical protein
VIARDTGEPLRELALNPAQDPSTTLPVEGGMLTS